GSTARGLDDGNTGGGQSPPDRSISLGRSAHVRGLALLRLGRRVMRLLRLGFRLCVLGGAVMLGSRLVMRSRFVMRGRSRIVLRRSARSGFGGERRRCCQREGGKSTYQELSHLLVPRSCWNRARGGPLRARPRCRTQRTARISYRAKSEAL